MMRIYTLFFFLLLMVSSCGNGESGKSSTSDSPATTASTEAAAKPAPAYPSISVDRLEYLWKNATYMDVVFYELPVALNQSTPEQIRSTIAHIAEDAPVIDPKCKPVGRIFFQVNGKNVEEADIYFQNGCTFYLWMKDGKPTHANNFTQAGIEFYNNIYAQVQQMNNPQ